MHRKFFRAILTVLLVWKLVDLCASWFLRLCERPRLIYRRALLPVAMNLRVRNAPCHSWNESKNILNLDIAQKQNQPILVILNDEKLFLTWIYLRNFLMVEENIMLYAINFNTVGYLCVAGCIWVRSEFNMHDANLTISRTALIRLIIEHATHLLHHYEQNSRPCKTH